ncbi:MAG TPA: carboxypeptidase-like regulatory domain-containing protein [Chitinophagaceae bacterium]|nr:carboxypeptidase-like regulatory domain-containing protein [Chitinophagaceae bacterium]
MKRILLFSCILLAGLSFSARAQFEKIKDSVVQLYGIVMTADSLQGIPAVSVVVKGQNRGTITNDQGVFSIVVMKGDQVEFTSIGYKPKLVEIPRELEGNQYSVIQLMVTDTVYLPATIIKPRPTQQQFERDFINTNVPADQLEIARQNTEESKRRILARSLPADGKEATNYALRNQANRYYYQGQAPPQNIFNPFAWSEFIQAWKRGDFKRK